MTHCLHVFLDSWSKLTIDTEIDTFLKVFVSTKQRLVQTVPKLNTFLYCQFGPFFEIHNGPNLIWERFGPTVISAGLIIITGSCHNSISEIVYKIRASYINES